MGLSGGSHQGSTVKGWTQNHVQARGRPPGGLTPGKGAFGHPRTLNEETGCRAPGPKAPLGPEPAQGRQQGRGGHEAVAGEGRGTPPPGPVHSWPSPMARPSPRGGHVQPGWPGALRTLGGHSPRPTPPTAPESGCHWALTPQPGKQILLSRGGGGCAGTGAMEKTGPSQPWSRASGAGRLSPARQLSLRPVFPEWVFPGQEPGGIQSPCVPTSGSRCCRSQKVGQHCLGAQRAAHSSPPILSRGNNPPTTPGRSGWARSRVHSAGLSAPLPPPASWASAPHSAPACPPPPPQSWALHPPALRALHTAPCQTQQGLGEERDTRQGGCEFLDKRAAHPTPWGTRAPAEVTAGPMAAARGQQCSGARPSPATSSGTG